MKDKLLTLIKKGFAEIIYANEDYYKDYKIVISNDLMYIDEQMRKAQENTIFIVVKFLPATLTYKQKIAPINISVLAEYNSIDVCYSLLNSYAEKFHLELDESETIKQFYTSPSIVSNFNEVFDGYRSLYYLSGTFLISENANRVKIKNRDTGEYIDTIESVFSCGIQLDTQPNYQSNNFTNSIARVGTRTLAITVNAIDVDFVNNALKVAFEELPIDTEFNFDLEFKNGIKLLNKKWKLASIDLSQSLSNFPVIALLFTN